MINTKAVTDRRKLRFDDLAALRAELDRIEQSVRTGHVRLTGNWTLGQILTHLAAFIDYGYDGYPPGFPTPPFFIRWIIRLKRNQFINDSMPVGVRIPGLAEGTVGARDVPAGEGLTALRKSVTRLEAGAPTVPNAIFGRMSQEDAIGMHLRHAELHLCFVHPE